MPKKAQFDERKVRRQDDGRFAPLHKPQRDRPQINAAEAEALADATADDGWMVPVVDAAGKTWWIDEHGQVIRWPRSSPYAHPGRDRIEAAFRRNGLEPPDV